MKALKPFGIALLALAGVAGLALGGCTSNQTSGTRPTARICDDTGCSDRDRNTAAAPVPDDSRNALLDDPDRYAGERIADLQAAAAGGDPVAGYKLGMAHLNGLGGVPRSPAKAAEWFRPAADAQHAWAQYRLARLYADGTGVRVDKRLSLDLTFAAARNGHPHAAYALGIAHLDGRGLPADQREAARWFAVAAQNGLADAQYNLGLMIYRGQAADSNLYDAVQWMRKAAQGGNREAQTALGRMYLTGLDTMGQDLPEAERWLTVAAGRGDRTAQSLLNDLQRQKQDDLEFRRRLALLQAETAQAWASFALATWLTRPRTEYVIVW